MKTSLVAAARFLAMLSAFMALPGCPHPVPSPGSPGIIDCTIQGVRDNGLPLIPKVNDCLTSGEGWQACLIGLINPVVSITEDVVACVVQSQAKSYGMAAAANPGDEVSNLAARRAQQFLEERHYQFAAPAPMPGK